MAYPRYDVAKTQTGVSVATSTTTVLAANPSRMEVTIVNDGANTVYLALALTPGVTPTAVAASGIRLNSGGGSWTSSSYTGAIAGIALTGATNCTVSEV